MLINKKFAATICLLTAAVSVAVASLPQDQPGFKNLKVLPKKTPPKVLHEVMEDWSHALGVHCNFCHARDEASGKMDFASDAKPEKQMARDMFKMTSAINKKYFKAEKDSLGMVMFSGVACATCHHGSPHPEVKMEAKGPGGPGMPPPPGGQGGTPPPPPPAGNN